MAKNVVTIVEMTDDLDGGKADRTVTFTFDGVAYEIDLSKKNATALEKTLKPYLAVARKVRRSGRRGAVASSASRGGRRDLSQVRVWARSNGYDISGRGRIPASILEAYDLAGK